MKKYILLSTLIFNFFFIGFSQELEMSIDCIKSQWENKNVAYLGDSITDKRRVGTKKNYWEYLEDILNIKSIVFAKSGHTWENVYHQADELHKNKIDSLDAILIFAGTNDYNANTDIGNMYAESLAATNHNGKEVMRKFRTTSYDMNTFFGRMNATLNYLKQHFPKQQIIVLTPLHRGYAQFGPTNIQPDERFANDKGFFIDDYVSAIKYACMQWSIPVVDLYAISGLTPLVPSNNIYFANEKSDLLHPNAAGHYKIALTLVSQLLTYPSTFK